MKITLQRANSMVRVMGGRCGTAVASLADLQNALGEPSYRGSYDDKVKMGWVFATPRGPAEVRDYWWNGPNEASIAAQSTNAARWLAAHLRTLGIVASGTDMQGKLVSQGRIGQSRVRA